MGVFLSKKGDIMKKIMLILGILAVLLIAGCGSIEQEPEIEMTFPDQGEQESPQIQPEIPQTQQELPEVVAIINGDEIKGAEISNMQMQMQMQGITMSVEEVLDQLIIQRLLIQEAATRGYEVSDQEIEQSFMQQGFSVDEIKEMLEPEGVSYEEFLEEQRKQAKFNLFVDDMFLEIEVTEEESLEFYEEISAEVDESYEEISEDIKMYLAEQKLDNYLIMLAYGLMEESELEILI
jgi:parvulin-like peptidyl-prolyl isomerase